MADDVQLTDLEVIAQFSLAVRSATAPRAAVVRALRSDLAWLTGAAAGEPVPEPAAEPVRPRPRPAAPARRGPRARGA